MCKSEPHDRIGCQKAGFNDVRKQRWFQGFDWQGLRARRIISPIDVEVKNPTDTNNFETVFEDPIDFEDDKKILEEEYVAGWDESF